MEKILTVPASQREQGIVYMTGNHHVSLPNIAPNGDILALSHLSQSLNALVEYEGEPLLQLLLNDAPLPQGSHSYTDSFIPTFESKVEGLAIARKIFAPEGIRGFVVRVELTADQATSGSLALRFATKRTLRTIFREYPLEANARYGQDPWTGAAVVELVQAGGISAVAMTGSAGYAASFDESAQQLAVRHNFTLQAGESVVFLFNVSIGCERDGACLAGMDMRRRADGMYAKYVETLRARRIALPNPVLEEIANRNLNFCYYFSVGYALDTSLLMLLTSKSSRYYVSGAYWARDCMLWAYPSLLRADPILAKEALLQSCTLYLKEGGNHAVYLNGAPLYPGFELDELVAPLIALRRYVAATGDTALLQDGRMQNAIAFTLQTLATWRDAASGLYKTELNPSDDPVAYPFLTYDNYLVLSSLRFLSENGMPRLLPLAEELHSALQTHCVRGQGDTAHFVWATDAKGAQEEYDDPPGSLLLLPYYGEVDAKSTLWQNTKKLYFSAQNPYYYEQGAVFGQGCEHSPAPWPMSLCNLLLAEGRNETLLAALEAMPMDGGIACETVHTEDGTLNTGAAFATFAGFLAEAIFHAYEN